MGAKLSLDFWAQYDGDYKDGTISARDFYQCYRYKQIALFFLSENSPLLIPCTNSIRYREKLHEEKVSIRACRSNCAREFKHVPVLNAATVRVPMSSKLSASARYK